ncbi:hypothetical protein ACFQ1E_08160 [Sphingomonas canadensis]|uniref:Uncharacterized protein n=1 Tax=Sphingomonas canadensis TaxID=1219257 RepID=A0ABW3H461_9SPHN|nr:hypothetical protein [Sphingomonas canadensis]MCW3836010.1 hypothetical protein [Sphingomonas canadensis]
MSWLPHISVGGWCGCTDDYEAEGFVIIIEWRSFVAELAFARKERVFDAEASDAAR